MFLSASNSAAQQMAIEIAKLEKIKQRKKELIEKQQQQKEKQQQQQQTASNRSRTNTTTSRTNINNITTKTNSTSNSKTVMTADSKKPASKGMFGFLKKDKHQSRDSKHASSRGGGGDAAADTGSAKGTVMTESTHQDKEASMRSARSVRSTRSKDPPTALVVDENGDQVVDVVDVELASPRASRGDNESGGGNNPRRQRRRRARSTDVPRFLQVDQDDTLAAGAKRHESRSVASRTETDDDEESSEPSTPPSKQAAAAKSKKSSVQDDEEETGGPGGVPFVIQVEDEEEGNKKSCLKSNKPEDNAVRPPVVSSVPEDGAVPLEAQATIIIPQFNNTGSFDDDAITCITMEDFKDIIKKPKRIPKRNQTANGTLKKKSGSKPKKALKKRRNKSSASASDTASRDSRDSCGTISDSRLAEILRKDLQSKNVSTLIAGIQLICTTAARGAKHRVKIVHFGALPCILQAIETHQVKNTEVVMACLIAIQKIAGKDPTLQQAVCELGGIPVIAAAMQVNMVKPDVLGLACKTLELITTCMHLPDDFDDEEDEDEYEDIPTKGAITVLSCCLMAHPKDKDIIQYSFCTLVNLTMNRVHMLQQLSDAGGVPLMAAAVEQKWKSKSRKNKALEDLPIILESVDDDSDEESDSESESSEEEDSDDDSSDEE